jgi:uncharacterized protein YdhG (YjbR/CyaY superfamily)
MSKAVPKSTAFHSVEEYLSAQPEAVRATLVRVRLTIRKAMPDAEEAISYNMPTYSVHGQRVLQFAAWRQHYSLYAASHGIVAAFAKELAPYKIQKGTISFPFSEPVPEKLIERIAKFRAKDAAAPKKA